MHFGEGRDGGLADSIMIKGKNGARCAKFERGGHAVHMYGDIALNSKIGSIFGDMKVVF